MGQDIPSQDSYLKIIEADDIRVEIINMGNKKVLLSYCGVEKELKQGESVIVLKMIMEKLNAKTIPN